MCLVISLLMVLTLSSYHMHAYTGEEDIVVTLCMAVCMFVCAR